MEKTSLIIEGKTKKVWATEDPNLVVFEMKDALSAGDGLRKDQPEGISSLKAAQIANLFGFLNKQGLPTAFHQQLTETDLLCDACDMVPLELVVRRYAWGSALRLDPSLKQPDGTPPYRYDGLVSHVFLKDSVVKYSDGKVVLMKEPDAVKLRDAGEAEVFTDPYVTQQSDGRWGLHSAYAPLDEASPLLVIDPVMESGALDTLFATTVIPAFEALEKAWAEKTVDGQPITLVDFKVEAGRRHKDGQLVLADELNGDSMRLWPGADPTAQIDKQLYREGAAVDAVLAKYKLIADLTGQF